MPANIRETLCIARTAFVRRATDRSFPTWVSFYNVVAKNFVVFLRSYVPRLKMFDSSIVGCLVDITSQSWSLLEEKITWHDQFPFALSHTLFDRTDIPGEFVSIHYGVNITG